MSEFSSHIEKTKQNESSGGCCPDPLAITKDFRRHSPRCDRRGTRFTTQAIVKLVPQAFDSLSLKYMYRNRAPLLIMSLRSLLFGHSGWALRIWPHLAAELSSGFEVDAASAWPAGVAVSSREVRRGRLSGHCSASLSSRLESAPSALALVPACSQSASGG